MRTAASAGAAICPRLTPYRVTEQSAPAGVHNVHTYTSCQLRPRTSGIWASLLDHHQLGGGKTLGGGSS
jgi:hypothetical protein